MAVVKAKEKEKGQKANPDRQRTRSAQSLPASGKTSQRPPRKPFSRQGSTRLAHVPHRPPPPGLDLQSLLKSKMSEQEFNAARAVVYAGADTHVCTLLEAAGIPPPPDEALEPPELTQQEKMTKCVSDFKKATNQLKKLVEKKAKLQARADRLKQDLEKLIGEVDQVDRDIATKDGEVQAAAQTFKDLTADSRSPAFSALEAVLAEAGHDLTEATRAKMKAGLVGKEDLPEDPFLARFNGAQEYFPREMPRSYGPARTDMHSNRPNPLDGAKPEGPAGTNDTPE